MVRYLSCRERLGGPTKNELDKATSMILSKKAEKYLFWTPTDKYNSFGGRHNDEVICAESLLGTLTRKTKKKKRK